MKDQWMIKGREFVNCNCNYGCPCQFNSPSTKGHCEAIASIIIDEGHFNEIKLNGLSFVYLGQWPGEIKDGKGRMQLIIDERANKDQRQALEKILTGESTEPGATIFYIFKTTMAEQLPTLYAPIEMTIDIAARTGQTKVKGLIEAKGTPLIDPFSKQETRRGIHIPGGFEYIYAEIGTGQSKSTAGLKIELNDTHGQFAVVHMNQSGVVRDQKLPFVKSHEPRAAAASS